MSRAPMFDPRLVPVVQVDNHLPAIAPDQLSPQRLRSLFFNPPRWEPELIAETRFSDRAPTAAAVLVPIVQREPYPTVLLTQRTLHLSSHSGQIAFPGGKADPEDVDAAATALREAEEEVGLPANQVEILGTLPIYTTGSAFLVTPVVGLVAPDVVLRPNAHEVADVFEVPFEFLMNPANHRHHVVDWQGARRRWLSMPYQDHGTERFIWGATAGMLRNLYRFIGASLS